MMNIRTDLPRRLSILRMKQLPERTGMARSTIYDKLNPKSTRYDPSFPKSIRISTGMVGWVESEVEAWIESRIEACRV